MSLADDFARQFPNQGPSAGLSRGRFWREAVEEGSISRTKTARASEQVRAPDGTIYWVHPGEVGNLKAQGWTQLSSGIPPKTGPSPEERRLAARQADADRRDAAFAAERTAPPIGFERTEAAYTAGGGRARAQAYAAAEAQARANKLEQDRLAAEELERKSEEAERVQGSIDNAANRPTAAIYARYLAGTMTESQVLTAIRQRIAARLEGMGIATEEDDPVIPFQQPGVTVESGSALVDRMVEAELKRLREVEFRGFTPQRNQGAGESDKAWQARLNTGWHLSETTAVTPQPGYTTLTKWNESTGKFDSITLESIMVDEIQKLLDVGFKVDTTTQTRPAVDTGTVVQPTTAAAEPGIPIPPGVTAAEFQKQLNKARRDPEEARIAAEIPLSPGDGTLPPLDPGLPFQADLGFMGGTQAGAATQEELSNLIRREREATQEGRNLELLDFLNRTFNYGGLSPIVQRPLSRAVGSGTDLTSQYFTQLFGQGSPTGQVPTQTFASFLQGGPTTAGNLQANLRNITGQLGQGGDSPFFTTLQGAFGDPKDVFGAALQPGLKRVAPAVRGAFESQAGQQFQNVLAADPMRFKSPRESFRWFGNKGYF
jgi:hypothetical protein